MNAGKLLLLVVFLGLQSCSQDPSIPFSAWDADGDGVMARAEFQQQWNGTDSYTNWDKDGDGLLERPEWQTSFDEYYYDWDNDQLPAYAEWDLNDDAALNEEEFARGTFDFWDANNDGRVSREEYTQRAGHLVR